MYCGCVNLHKNLQVQTHLYMLSHQPCHLHIHPRSRSPTTTAHPQPPLPICVHHPHPLPSTSRIRYVFFSFLLFVLFFFTGRICPPSTSARIATHPCPPSGKYIFFFFVYTHPRLQATHQPANTSARIRVHQVSIYIYIFCLHSSMSAGNASASQHVRTHPHR